MILNSIFEESSNFNGNADAQQTVEVQLLRMSGSLELTSELPPEIVELEVNIDAKMDKKVYDVEKFRRKKSGSRSKERRASPTEQQSRGRQKGKAKAKEKQ